MRYVFVFLTAKLQVITSAIAKNDQEATPVDMTTIARAETDRYLARYVAQGAIGKFLRVRELVRIE